MLTHSPAAALTSSLDQKWHPQISYLKLETKCNHKVLNQVDRQDVDRHFIPTSLLYLMKHYSCGLWHRLAEGKLLH